MLLFGFLFGPSRLAIYVNDSWNDMAPNVTDPNDPTYQNFIAGENNRFQNQARHDFQQLMQAWNQNDQNPMPVY